jgi:hypothetical protein
MDNSISIPPPSSTSVNIRTLINENLSDWKTFLVYCKNKWWKKNSTKITKVQWTTFIIQVVMFSNAKHKFPIQLYLIFTTWTFHPCGSSQKEKGILMKSYSYPKSFNAWWRALKLFPYKIGKTKYFSFVFCKTKLYHQIHWNFWTLNAKNR